MGNHRTFSYIVICLHLTLHLSSVIICLEDNFDESFDAVLQDHAFKAMLHRRPHTGALYNATLPSYLAGMKVSVVGLRSKTLWRKGANFSDFLIPPKTLPVPYVKRLLIVYHNLGNWSSSYYSLSGYTLISPVIGFLVYDASQLSSKNLSKLDLNMMGKPISVNFQNSTPMRARTTRDKKDTKCAVFEASNNGQVHLADMSLPNVCYSRSQGHFFLVVSMRRKQQMWPIWIVGSLAGALGVVVGVAAVMVAAKSFAGKRNQEILEKEADEGECLETFWIVDSKLPRAEVTRTQPVLESITTLPNPKLSWYA